MKRKCFTLVELLITRMKRKCFTLVELLVVIGIIAVLMGILLPALNAVKRTAQRVVCGSNLSGIGKGMLLYANEYGGDYPRAGDAGSRWGSDGDIFNWADQSGIHWGNRSPKSVTITSSLYMLVKWADVTPGQFNCKGDQGIRELSLSDAPNLPPEIDDVTDVWDFGGKRGPAPTLTGNQGWSGQYNSYAYHSPYDNPLNSFLSYPLGSFSDPAAPVCADRNPYMDKNARTSYVEVTNTTQTPPICDATLGYQDPDKAGNAAAHQREGQNVLFNDTHVGFARFPNVGISKDNIWKAWMTTTAPTTACDRELGKNPFKSQISANGGNGPWSESDAFLVSEHNFGSATTMPQ